MVKGKKKKNDADAAVEKTVEAEVEAVELTEEKVGEEETEERDELESTKEELEKAQSQATEYLDGWQRTQAEFSNYKKRQEAERMQMMVLANAALLRKLLPVVDDFARAMNTLPANSGQETWFEGITLIQHKLESVIESEGVKLVETEGLAFDPRYHEAVTYEEAEGYEDGQIIGEVQRGYVLGERVLRPALVRVAKAPVMVPQSEKSEQAKE
ncbi:MAG: nucleotide exchange factor GrpE [Chloroflexi bacterium]|nr:nucleotide exchange factor GrpE [Chloroflexota bacterium]